MKNPSTKKLVLAALFLALAYLLPFLTGQIPEIGSMLLPMHLPVLICGFVCGWPYGLAVGFIAPLLRSFTLGMPPFFPTAVAMAFELAAYGAITGICYKKLPKKPLFLYVDLLAAMIGGRIVWGDSHDHLSGHKRRRLYLVSFFIRIGSGRDSRYCSAADSRSNHCCCTAKIKADPWGVIIFLEWIILKKPWQMPWLFVFRKILRLGPRQRSPILAQPGEQKKHRISAPLPARFSERLRPFYPGRRVSRLLRRIPLFTYLQPSFFVWSRFSHGFFPVPHYTAPTGHLGTLSIDGRAFSPA